MGVAGTTRRQNALESATYPARRQVSSTHEPLSSVTGAATWKGSRTGSIVVDESIMEALVRCMH